ncbi:hypothetical protein B0T19DRAFT_427055 [Cercophora scortea]|uniref:BHLH domain-containing protein n=1 Tax=Cercophora scortea TaxID=314031 RepID=A0AAE0M9U9_9PEZI|nr:hypothetical protein B0T19DRAFT_427055 [Cercophora scortea]
MEPRQSSISPPPPTWPARLDSSTADSSNVVPDPNIQTLTRLGENDPTPTGDTDLKPSRPPTSKQEPRARSTAMKKEREMPRGEQSTTGTAMRIERRAAQKANRRRIKISNDSATQTQTKASNDDLPEPTLTNPSRDSLPTTTGKINTFKARADHNRVEQRYRNRLNAHFDKLLHALPPTSSSISGPGPTERGHGNRDENDSNDNDNDNDKPRTTDDGPGSREGRDARDAINTPGGNLSSPTTRAEQQGRRISKSEVLDRARIYIAALEMQHARLAAEKRELNRRLRRRADVSSGSGPGSGSGPAGGLQLPVDDPPRGDRGAGLGPARLKADDPHQGGRGARPGSGV